MAKRYFSALVCIFCLMFLFGIHSVSAQEEQSTGRYGSIELVAVEDAPRAQIETEYRDLLLDYREQDQAFRLALSDWKQLDTLASLDKAVLATAELQRTRALVLRAYLVQLHLALQEVEADAGEVDNVFTRLEDVIEALERHEIEIATVKERHELFEVTQFFELLEPEIESVVAKSISTIRFARLERANRLTGELLELFELQIEPGTTLDRRFRIIRDEYAGVQVDRIEAEIELAEVKENRSGANGYLRELDPIFAGLGRVHGFIDELLNGVR